MMGNDAWALLSVLEDDANQPETDLRRIGGTRTFGTYGTTLGAVAHSTRVHPAAA